MQKSDYLISTDKFPRRHRHEMWIEEFAKKLFRIEWDALDDSSFFAGMSPLLAHKTMTIVDIAGGPTRLVNTPQYAANKHDMLSLYILGQGENIAIERFSSTEKMHSSMGIFLDEGQYYKNYSDHSLSTGFVIGLSKYPLVADVPNLQDLLDRPFDKSVEAYRLLLSLLGEISRSPPQDASLINSTSHYIHDLLILMLKGRDDAVFLAQMRGLRAVRLKEILRHINQNYANHELTGKSVAAHFGFSERYLQDLLKENGRTFSSSLLHVRLKKAALMLQDPTLHYKRISDIAYSCGFNDISTFNRAFRQFFGETPRAHRR